MHPIWFPIDASKTCEHESFKMSESSNDDIREDPEWSDVLMSELSSLVFEFIAFDSKIFWISVDWDSRYLQKDDDAKESIDWLFKLMLLSLRSIDSGEVETVKLEWKAELVVIVEWIRSLNGVSLVSDECIIEPLEVNQIQMVLHKIKRH